MIQTIKKIFVLFFTIAFLASCENPFGDKTNLSFIDVPNYDEQPIAFVPIQPALKDFDYIWIILKQFGWILVACVAVKVDTVPTALERVSRALPLCVSGDDE